MKLKRLCDYCGGYLVDPGENGDPVKLDSVPMHIRGFDLGHEVDRKLCIECLVKALDKVLGKPRASE